MSTSGASPVKFDNLPEGTVTFLFTDIEGSTELLKRLGEGYKTLLADQRNILRDVFSRWNGQEVDTQGDSFFVSFPRASEALNASVEAQRALAGHIWPGGVEVRVRMGLHTGEPLTWAEGYVGIDVHRAARIAAVGHGGQVLLSQTTAPLVQDSLPEGVALVDLGCHRLKDLRTPERIGQLVIEGLPAEFPPLKSLEVLPVEVPLELAATRPPEFLKEGAEPPARSIFVARERELAWLNERLDLALNSEGQIAFVSGGPGRGKSALLEEFMRQAMAAQPELLAVRGESSAHTGIGDPYQPFRGALGMLLGDLEGAWASGTLDRDSALRLWQTMPRTAQVLLETGPDLIDVFVPERTLLSRLYGAVERGSSLLGKLAKQVEAERLSPGELSPRNLFEQVEGLLIELSGAHPIVLVLDDLQWADTASINLLFHLGRRLKGRRLLILGAYRSEEVTIGREDELHPLEKLLAESKRLHGEITLNLGAEEEGAERAFVDAFIDTEPNALGEGFRQALVVRTEGHPLFTVELLRAMQERGDLVRNEDGQWVEGEKLDWNALPARVEGVIEERLGRLEPELRELLAVASVEGVGFSAQVVAGVGDSDTAEVVGHLSTTLAKVHRLVTEQGVIDLPEQRIYQYRFRHQLFQQHVYNSLGPFRQELMHGKVGHIKERLYGERVDEIAPDLARHFSLAGDREKALEYLLRAGDRARMVYAHTEAVTLYRRALDMFQEADDSERAARTFMKLGLVYTANFDHANAKSAYARAFQLWERGRESESKTHPLPSRTLRMAVAEPHTLDPGLMSDDMSSFIAQQLYEGLVQVDKEYNVLPAAAVRWEVMDEGMRYIFHMRSGRFWSDGTPCTASDYEFAWKRNLGLSEHSPNAKLLYVIENARAYGDGEVDSADEVGVRALDDLCLEIRLEQPTAFLPYLLALPVACPLPRWAGPTDERSEPDPLNRVTNGPYRLVEWLRGERLILEINPHYLGSLKGNVMRIECPFAQGFATLLDAFEQDQLDAISMIAADPQTIADAHLRFRDQLQFTPRLSTFFIYFRADQPPFDDARVRRAFVHCVDREVITRITPRGLYLPGTGGFIPPGMPAHTPGLGLGFDPERARSLIKEVGISTEETFTDMLLLYSGGAGNEQLVEYICSSWKDHLDIRVTPQSMPWDEYVARRDHDPAPMMLMGWSADYPDPDDMLRILFHGSDGLRLPRWDHPRFNVLVEDAGRTFDPGKRMELYREADRILVAEEVVILPLGYAQGRHLAKPWVGLPKVPPHFLRVKDVVLGDRA